MLLAGASVAVGCLTVPCQIFAQQTAHQTRALMEFSDEFSQFAPVPAAQVAEGWVALFDGSTLFGWRMKSESWTVENNALKNTLHESMLRTASQFDDFELVIEYQAAPGTEASLFLRTSPQPASSERDCYEVRLASPSEETQFDIGEIAKRQQAEVSDRVKFDSSRKVQTIQVRCIGGLITVRHNGQRVNEYEDTKPLGRGYVGLRCKSGQLQVKKFWLRPILDLPLFNGRDLTGWTSSKENDFDAAVEDLGKLPAMKLTGGPGYLESDRQFKNFVLQLQAKISPGGNSGLFYRCIPGENTNGYESQIDNSNAESTSDSPANCGTGGIFRRKDARRIVATDEQWFAKTIVAEGPHVAVWVNGYQVTDWTDKRKPNANPRRGLCRDAGTLMLQGHDAETTAWFREINIRELQKRNR